jgi:hypothetical protein
MIGIICNIVFGSALLTVRIMQWQDATGNDTMVPIYVAVCVWVLVCCLAPRRARHR